jgi:hypothetical protein
VVRLLESTLFNGALLASEPVQPEWDWGILGEESVLTYFTAPILHWACKYNQRTRGCVGPRPDADIRVKENKLCPSETRNPILLTSIP